MPPHTDTSPPVPKPQRRTGQRLLMLDGAADLPRMHRADAREDAAVAVLQGADHPSVRNNLAVARFTSGRVAQAREVAEANRQSPLRRRFAD